MEWIDEWLNIHEEEMVEDIRRLVRIPSIAGGKEENYPYGKACGEAADCFVHMARSYGLNAGNEDNAYASVTYGIGSKRVEIWTHLDVVAEGSGWMYPPYECMRIGDFLIGRGVSDNKGAVVAVLYTLRFLKEIGFEPKYELKQVCGLSEEAGMGDITAYLKRYGKSDYAFVADCRFPLCYGEKGRCVMTLESDRLNDSIIQEFYAGEADNSVAERAFAKVGGKMLVAEGIAGHAAAPEKCENPIGILAETCCGLLKQKGVEFRTMKFLQATCSEGYGIGLGIDCETAEFGRLTCQGTRVRFENSRLKITYDIRFPAGTAHHILVNHIKMRAGQYGFRIKETTFRDGYLRNRQEPWIQALLESYRIVTGDQSEPYTIGGNTYAVYLDGAVPFGPVIPKDFSSLDLPKGHGVGHGIDEVQSVESLKTAVKVYVTALKLWSETIEYSNK